MSIEAFFQHIKPQLGALVAGAAPHIEPLPSEERLEVFKHLRNICFDAMRDNTDVPKEFHPACVALTLAVLIDSMDIGPPKDTAEAILLLMSGRPLHRAWGQQFLGMDDTEGTA